jgi:hypothetical protein
MEKRKDEILARRLPVRHPVLLTETEFNRARRNIRQTRWAATWYRQVLKIANHVAAQPSDYVERMIPELTPTNPYGFTCPHCVGRRSQEGMGVSMFDWDYRRPDVIRCKVCGQIMPSTAYPERGRLTCPRAGQTFHFYLNEAERRHPQDRSGRYAWRWVGQPIHVSFSGIVRETKVLFMLSASRNLALAYRFTGQSRYAACAVRILRRLAYCNRRWLYHDFYDTVADCDPLYAAWHDMALKIEWKRHASARAYGDSCYETGPVDDTPTKAKMLATYFGCGRIHPSANAWILNDVCGAYDLVHDAVDSAGRALWDQEGRTDVERNLILETIIEAEPFVGGPGKALPVGNKAPYVFLPMAYVGKCLGLPNYTDVALKGYEALRDHCFLHDGASCESPAYTDMYLSKIICVPEVLHGFRWPRRAVARSGTVNVYKNDSVLKRIIQTVIESRCPDGRLLPLSDTPVNAGPSPSVFEIGLRRYPHLFRGALPSAYRACAAQRQNAAAKPRRDRRKTALPFTEYAVFHHRNDELQHDAPRFSEILFPAWQTAVLRHGQGPTASVLALPFNPPGGHRHADNLGLYYVDSGRAILGELGYVGDSAMRGWGHSTASHNLVVVDDSQQCGAERKPRLRLMATSPRVSVVEAESDAYPQCREYRRRVALIKGPQSQTFVMDLFRVQGGRKHAYRIFSELAASDAVQGRREFVGLCMPQEPPLPDFGASIAPEHVYGLRDVRVAKSPPSSWQASWVERGDRYRLWMLSAVDRVEMANGPGQETPREVGRRLRYLDAIDEGGGRKSAFVTVHEPRGRDGDMPIHCAVRLDIPAKAGPDAVALRIESAWGTYWIFNDFVQESQIEGIAFKGTFGVLCDPARGAPWLMSCGTSTLRRGRVGFVNEPAQWAGRIERYTETDFSTGHLRPIGWPAVPVGVVSYVRVGDGRTFSGYPVVATSRRRIAIGEFPLQRGTHFELQSVRFC